MNSHTIRIDFNPQSSKKRYEEHLLELFSSFTVIDPHTLIIHILLSFVNFIMLSIKPYIFVDILFCVLKHNVY